MCINHHKIFRLLAAVFFLFFIESCRRAPDLLPYTFHPSVDSLLQDPASVNPVYDSLKNLLPSAEDNLQRNRFLAQMTEEIQHPVAGLLLDDLEKLSDMSKDEEGRLDVVSRKGLQALREQDFVKADSLLQWAASASFQKGFFDVCIRSLVWLAEVKRVNGLISEAGFAVQRAITISDSTGNKSRLPACYLTQGLIKQFEQDHHAAFVCWDKSMQIARQLKNPSAVADVYRARADLFRIQGDEINALSCFQNSLQWAKRANNQRLMAFCLIGMADLFIKRNDIDRALEQLNLAKRNCERLSNKALVLSVMTKEAEIATMRGDENRAEEIMIKALEIAKSAGNKKKEAQILAVRGDIMFRKGLMVEALGYFEDALELARLHKEKNVESYCLSRISSFNLKKNDFQQARKNAEASLGIALKGKSDNDIINAAYALSDIYRKLGMFEEALESYMLFADTRNRTSNLDVQKRFDRLVFENIRERDAANAQIKALAQENEIENQKRVRNVFVIAAIGLVLLLLLIVRSYVEKQKSNKLLREKNELIDFQRQETIKSIEYAGRIQKSILSDTAILGEFVKEAFVVYKPKDIVSGDFYTFFPIADSVLVVCADCTGHGVPGAFMSMLGYSLLNQIILEKKVYNPSEILSMLNVGIIEALHQKRKAGNDGMDLALLRIFRINNHHVEIQFSGANRPLWLFRQNGEISEIKGDKSPLGGYYSDEKMSFNLHTISLNLGDRLYLSTDGYADQFGGAFGKKMMKKRFLEQLASTSHLSMEEQGSQLSEFFETYRGEQEQIDDVCVIGLRV